MWSSDLIHTSMAHHIAHSLDPARIPTLCGKLEGRQRFHIPTRKRRTGASIVVRPHMRAGSAGASLPIDRNQGVRHLPVRWAALNNRVRVAVQAKIPLWIHIPIMESSDAPFEFVRNWRNWDHEPQQLNTPAFFMLVISFFSSQEPLICFYEPLEDLQKPGNQASSQSVKFRDLIPP